MKIGTAVLIGVGARREHPRAVGKHGTISRISEDGAVVTVYVPSRSGLGSGIHFILDAGWIDPA